MDHHNQCFDGIENHLERVMIGGIVIMRGCHKLLSIVDPHYPLPVFDWLLSLRNKAEGTAARSDRGQSAIIRGNQKESLRDTYQDRSNLKSASQLSQTTSKTDSSCWLCALRRHVRTCSKMILSLDAGCAAYYDIKKFAKKRLKRHEKTQL